MPNEYDITCPCRICGRATRMLGTKLCDPCWNMGNGVDAAKRLLAEGTVEARKNVREMLAAALARDDDKGAMRVYIASPFRGATKEETRQNIVYARLCMLDSLERGEAPYLSHLLYTQVYAETPELREAGLRAGDAWRAGSELVAEYTDLGSTVGMQRAIFAAARDGIPTATRSVHWRAAKALDHLDTAAAWRARLALLPLDGFAEIRA